MYSPNKLLLTLLMLTLPYTSNVLAVEEYNEDVQAIVDKVHDLSKKARKERAADRWLLRSLDDLVTQYTWPWRNELLFEDFSDGNFTQEPSWKVLNGEFWVDATLGLRSRVDSRQHDRYRDEEQKETKQSSEDKQDLGSALLGALLSGAMQPKKESEPPRKKQQQKARQAKIQLPLKIPPAFAFSSEFSAHNAPSETGTLQFALYQGSRGNFGYILTINTGDNPSLKLFQRFRGRSILIETIKLEDLNDGQLHKLEWRMTDYGDIELLLDQQSLLQSRDRSFSKGFKQLAIINKGGDFGIRSIQLQGGAQLKKEQNLNSTTMD